MTWTTYQVVLRLQAPMHIGRAKIGNVQRTRGYVTGRVLWGALTERLTRDELQGREPATDSRKYQAMGERVHDQLAFTYFYPTTDKNGTVALWPWNDGFRPRFLSTYAGTALAYPHQGADEGTLHEVEFISPRTLDTGDPVYLVGYVFEREGAPDWQPALHRLQLGGERGYGWGRVEPVRISELEDELPLFDGVYTTQSDGWPPVLKAQGRDDDKSVPLLAHALAADFEDEDTVRRAVTGVQGEIEPLVGRETRPKDGSFGMQVSEARICYAPGSEVSTGVSFKIGPYGVWERSPEQAEGAVGDATP